MKQLYLFTFLIILTTPLLGQPCSSPGHNQFDFWLGEWEVYHTQADTIVGYNTIRKILNGCVLEENWTGKSGFKGKSFNTYDPVDSTWNQVWVDVSGATYHFKGKYSDNHMALEGETAASGNLVMFALDFYHNEEDNTVRQVWKQSKDFGENWATIFDGTYKRKKE